MQNRRLLLPIGAAALILVLMVSATMAAQPALGLVLSSLLAGLALVLTWKDPSDSTTKDPEVRKSKKR